MIETNQQNALANSRFLRACRREPVDCTPVWMMRQAGRYLPEYRAIREKVPFLQMCHTPRLAAEVTCQPIERFNLDAAILFADILLILEPMGAGLSFRQGEGPHLEHPVREPEDIEKLSEVNAAESLAYVFEATRLTRAALPADIPLIGFAAAPFTLASYLIEGGSSRDYRHTKTLMYQDPGAWRALMERLTRALIGYLNGQIAAGASAVQVFDSWVGALSPDDYRDYVLEHSAAVIAGLSPKVPVIHFGTGTAGILELIAQAGGDVIGVDWRLDLDVAWRRIGDDRGIQGNLDPVVLLADQTLIRRRVQVILDWAGSRSGHIFNLGHGILPYTPVEHAAAMIDAVHELSAH